MHAKSLQPCLTLCDPMDCSSPGSSVHGILHPRILEWVDIPFSRSSNLRLLHRLHWQVGSSPLAPRGKCFVITLGDLISWYFLNFSILFGYISFQINVLDYCEYLTFKVSSNCVVKFHSIDFYINSLTQNLWHCWIFLLYNLSIVRAELEI